MASFELTIVTPERAVFAGRATDVVLPGSLGEMDVLPGHRPLTTLLRPGEVRAATDDGTRHFAVGSGYAELDGSHVTILVSYCEGVDEIDIDAAGERLKALEKQNVELIDNDEELAAHTEELARSRARLKVLESARKSQSH